MKRDLHQIRNPRIEISESWNRQDQTLIDVRSPQEYSAGHIPGAINIPLLEDKERETIGILYKHFGQQKAVEKGYEFFESKLDSFCQQFEKLSKTEQLVIYCARGGMRSQVVSSFLNYMEYQAKQLTGGYKTFRNWNLSRLQDFKFTFPVVLYGRTGVGKTLVLDRLENTLDLEGIADHRGSIFGGIGKSPVSQKTFEAQLLVSLEKLDNTKPVFIEGESRKVGDSTIPDSIFSQMRSARKLLLDASMETRVQRTVYEYVDKQPETLPVTRSTIEQLTNDLGKKPVSRLLDLFDEGNYAECFEYILEHYYDKKYGHSMKKLNFDQTISTEDLDQACKEIREYAIRLMNKTD